MRYAKKITALILAMLLCISLMQTAFAAQEGTLTVGTITINNAVVGQTYKVYQLAYLESYNTSANAYSYKANSQWKTWLQGQTNYVTVDGQDYVTWINTNENKDSDGNLVVAATFAKLALENAKSANFTADASATATTTTVSFTNLKPGYYLVDTTLGSFCALGTTTSNNTVTVKEKNFVPTLTKTVKENSSNSYGSSNDVSIGVPINFKIEIEAKKGAVNYKTRDCLQPGFTFNNDITIHSTSKNGNLALNTDYTVEYHKIENTTQYPNEINSCGTEYANGTVIRITFTESYMNSIPDSNDKLTITYTAYLNSSATISTNTVKNPNKSYALMTYGDNWTTTQQSATETNTWTIPIYKFTNHNGTKALAGAEFELYYNNGKLKFSQIDSNTGVYRYDTTQSNTTLVSASNGCITLKGLDGGQSYVLKETKAPAGYNKLASDITIEVKHDGTISISGGGTLENNTVKVENKSGSLLPKTGGIGAVIFYTVDGIVILAFIIAIIVRRRRKLRRVESGEGAAMPQ
ncbi:MAG: SpaH/EbpB family LPXTG-anchored major pilin [Acutalibacteraceae bacterium]